nr:MAG TPA_asm: PNC27 Protein [Caudoviricetes sp.]
MNNILSAHHFQYLWCADFFQKFLSKWYLNRNRMSFHCQRGSKATRKGRCQI